MTLEKKRKIAILGCGWLGLPLAEKLVKLGHQVNGSTTREKKQHLIQSKGITPYLVQCDERRCLGLDPFLEDVDCLILTLPPGLRQNPQRRFDLIIEKLEQKIRTSSVRQLIFISSTSVYGNVEGVVDEKITPLPTTESGKQLLKCEKHLLNSSHFSTTILRFGGLIGPNRHPVHSLAKRTFLENPNGEINLIHLNDCLQCIWAIIEKQKKSTIYNAVSPYHPSRKTYYTLLAENAGIQLPPFKNETTFSRKINSDKIQNALGIRFKVENLLTLN